MIKRDGQKFDAGKLRDDEALVRKSFWDSLSKRWDN